MIDINVNLSYGTCYYDDSGEEAPSRYIPCGNSAISHVSCCESQDVCLSSNACYNGQFGVTYLAGCTDEDYKHESCPRKGDFSNQILVGLVYCNGSSNEWTGCRESELRETVAVPDPCWCPQTSRSVLFEDASTLANIMRLPTATGESVSWFGSPTRASVSTSAPLSSISTSTASDSPSSTTASASEPSITFPTNLTTAAAFPSTTSTPETTSLSVRTKVGIGIGAGIGCFVLLILLVMMIRQCLAKHEKNKAETEEKGQMTSAGYSHVPQESRHENTETRSPGWSDYKAELPSLGSKLTPSPTYAGFGNNKSEVEGSPAVGGAGRPVSNGGYEMPGKPGTVYEMSA